MDVKIRMGCSEDALRIDLVNRICRITNQAYRTTDKGLWHNHWTRTNDEEVKDHLRQDMLALAFVNNYIAGCCKVEFHAEGVASFGMLACAPEYQGNGIGSALLSFSEKHAKNHGYRIMQLETMIPIPAEFRVIREKHLAFLEKFYRSKGYAKQRRIPVFELYPELQDFLVCDADLDVYFKQL